MEISDILLRFFKPSIKSKSIPELNTINRKIIENKLFTKISEKDLKKAIEYIQFNKKGEPKFCKNTIRKVNGMSTDYLEKSLKDPTNSALLYYDNTMLVAILIFKYCKLNNGSLYIDAFCINQRLNYTNKKFLLGGATGRLIINDIKRIAMDNGINNIITDSIPSVHSYYKKQGFIDDKTRNADGLIPMI